MSREKVAVALSGGVDSSVACALLKEQGYEVEAFTLRLLPPLIDSLLPAQYEACCRAEAVAGAREVAAQLGVPWHLVPAQEVFEKSVLRPFFSGLAAGTTPNPCVACNEAVKFGVLMERAREIGAERVATGHYARIEACDGRPALLRALDQTRDQSYFLCALPRALLPRLLFPLGQMKKVEVRRLAAERGLATAARPESQDICFLPPTKRETITEAYLGAAAKPGAIRLAGSGQVIGEHRGVAYYTVGQRRGLRVSAGEPLYVVAIDAHSNEVWMGRENLLLSRSMLVSEVNWLIEPPHEPLEAEVRIRYRARAAEATVSPDGASARVDFAESQRAITPGQAAVFYRGDLVLGGGTIVRSLSEPEERVRDS